MNDRWSSSATLADGGRGRPRSAWTQILSALVLVCVLALLAVSLAGWIFMAALSTLILAVVTQTVRSFEFVVITAMTPAVAETAIADVVRARPMWSPMPAIRAQAIESVGGSNIHVHQRPRFFWIFVMLDRDALRDHGRSHLPHAVHRRSGDGDGRAVMDAGAAQLPRRERVTALQELPVSGLPDVFPFLDHQLAA
jgi:hypothetical protein